MKNKNKTQYVKKAQRLREHPKAQRARDTQGFHALALALWVLHSKSNTGQAGGDFT